MHFNQECFDFIIHVCEKQFTDKFLYLKYWFHAWKCQTNLCCILGLILTCVLPEEISPAISVTSDVYSPPSSNSFSLKHIFTNSIILLVTSTWCGLHNKSFSHDYVKNIFLISSLKVISFISITNFIVCL